MGIVRSNHAGASAGGHTLADVALAVPAALASDVLGNANPGSEGGNGGPVGEAAAAEFDGAIEGPEFQRLLAGLAAHQDWAITRLYRVWAARAEGVARGIVRGDEAACQDVVQGAFMRVIQSPPKNLPDAAAMDRWMARAVVSSAIDFLRRETSQRRRLAVAASATAGSGASNGAGTAASLGSDSAERIAELEARLQAIDERDRELIAMHHGRGMTLAAIAAALGQTLGSVHGRLRRAMEKLRRAEAGGGGVDGVRGGTKDSLAESRQRTDR